MSIGSKVVSVFGGPADREKYGETDSFAKKVIPLKQYSSKETRRHDAFQRLRDLREKGGNEDYSTEIFNSLVDDHHDEWLLFIELLEVCAHRHFSLGFKNKVEEHLYKIKNDQNKQLIELGMNLADED